MTSKLSPLAQALVVTAMRGHDRHVNGKALTKLRQDVLAGAGDTHPAANKYLSTYKRLVSISVDDVVEPNSKIPSIDDVALLIEALALCLRSSQSAAWKSIGVRPDTGRGYLSGRTRVTWPVWYTLISKYTQYDSGKINR